MSLLCIYGSFYATGFRRAPRRSHGGPNARNVEHPLYFCCVADRFAAAQEGSRRAGMGLVV